jgi:hypothetical protein
MLRLSVLVEEKCMMALGDPSTGCPEKRHTITRNNVNLSRCLARTQERMKARSVSEEASFDMT